MSGGSAPSMLEAIHEVYSGIPLTVSLPFHCIFVASLFEQLRNRWLLSFWITYFGALGGGTATAYLMHEFPAVFKDASIGLIYAASWWAYNYTFVGSLFHALPPFRWISKAMCNMLKAKTICAFVGKAIAMFPGVPAAVLVLGTLSGCGGKMISDGMKNVAGLLPGNSELTEPGFSLHGSFLSAAANYLLCHVTEVLSIRHGEALVVAVLVVHGLAQDLTGSSLDFTYPIRWLIHLFARIPMTGDVPIVIPAPKRVYNKAQGSVGGVEREAQQQREASGAGTESAGKPAVSSKTKKAKKTN